MSPTRSRCFSNPEVVDFDAVITKVKHEQNKYKILLNNTYFFPKGGGQPADRGCLNGVEVQDVYEDETGIFHVVEGRVHPGPVHAEIDPVHRMDFMQQHTGQHVISAALWKRCGYQTISVHMGKIHTTIDIDTGHISQKELYEVERYANQIINANLEVDSEEVEPDRLHSYPLRKPIQSMEKARLVHIQGIDWVGCCGMHLMRTGLVGLVQCIGFEKIRGMTRLIWKIGDRAYLDYRIKIKLLDDLRGIFGTQEGRIREEVSKLILEKAQLSRQNHALAHRLAVVLGDSLIEKAHRIGNNRICYVRHEFEDESQELILQLCKYFIVRNGVVFFLTNRIKDLWHWSVGCFEALGVDLTGSMQALVGMGGMRGGGRHPLWQGVGSSKSDLDRIETHLRKVLEDESPKSDIC